MLVREEIVTGWCGTKRPNWSKNDWNDWHDIRNTLRVSLTTIISTGRSILLRKSKPRSFTESVPWWLASCSKFVFAKHSLYSKDAVLFATHVNSYHKRIFSESLHINLKANTMNDKSTNFPAIYYNVLNHEWNLSVTGLPWVLSSHRPLFLAVDLLILTTQV